MAGENSDPWAPWCRTVHAQKALVVLGGGSDRGHSEMALGLQHSGVVNGEPPPFTDGISHTPSKGHSQGPLLWASQTHRLLHSHTNLEAVMG